MKFKFKTSSLLFYILCIGLLSIVACDTDDQEEQTLDGIWELKKITTSEDEIITEEFWGSVIWKFDISKDKLEILIDYNIIIENNIGGENDPDGYFIGLTDGTYALRIFSDEIADNIQIGDSTEGSFVLDGNNLVLILDYDNGEFTSTEIYYFEK